MLKNITKLLFQWGGRASRREYIFAYAWFIIINMILILAFLILAKGRHFLVSSFFLLIVILSGYISTNLAFKRGHDLGYSFKRIIRYGILLGFDFDLILIEGQKKTNLYGEPIYHRTKISSLLGSFFVFLFIISFCLLGIKIIEYLPSFSEYFSWIKINLSLFGI